MKTEPPANECPKSHCELCITVYPADLLIIEFPHKEWAECYLQKTKTSNDKRFLELYNPHINKNHPCHVRMKLPQGVSGMQARARNGKFEAVLIFKKKEFAKEWADHSELWQKAADSQLKVVLSTSWSHKNFDGKMGLQENLQQYYQDLEKDNTRGQGSGIY